MLAEIHPKLPMRNKTVTRNFYIEKLGFTDVGSTNFDDYLMLQKDTIQLHFFAFADLDPASNYGQVYIRTNNIEEYYQWLLDNQTPIHPAGPLQAKPWGQQEFSILDPDCNLLTFGQSMTL